jgi:hypothetical protein
VFSLHGARVSPDSGDSVGIGLVLARQGMGALDAWLGERDYSPRSRDGIAVHVRANGELAGCVPESLDREDLETATEVFCEALPPVPQTSRDWDVEGYPTPCDARPLLATVELGPDDILPADDQPELTSRPCLPRQRPPPGFSIRARGRIISPKSHSDNIVRVRPSTERRPGRFSAPP